MNPAEKRIKELIDRWLTSIELHLQYTGLSDEAYWELRNWPKHDRPTRWVLELAKQKATELRDAVTARIAMGDSKFSDALELMAFLANLVGAQHVERFVPLAEPLAETDAPPPKPRATVSAPESSGMPKWFAQGQTVQPPAPQPKFEPTQVVPQRPVPANPKPQSTPQLHRADPETTREMPAARQQPQRMDREATREMPAPHQPLPKANPEATREMPKLRGQPAASNQTRPAAPAKTEPRKMQRGQQNQAAAARQAPTKEPEPQDEMETMVIADAVRMLSWGKTWHELAELIARLADRPSQAEVRKILRAHRAAVEKAAKAAK